jgi:diguanylate cyclase (GGDEF)-like protein
MSGILKFVSLKTKLITSLTAVLFFAFLLTNIINYTVSRDVIRNTIIQNTLPATGSNIYSEIQKDLMRPIFISSLMANDTFLKDWVLQGEKDVEALTRYLEEIRSRYGFFTSFFVSEKTSIYYSYKGIHKMISLSDEHDIWYYRFRSSGADYELDVDTDEVSANTLTIFINQRLKDYDGKFLGATGVGLNMDHVGQLLVSYKKQFNRNIYLIDPDGTMQVHPEIGLVENLSIRNQEGISGIADRILSEKAEPAVFEYYRNGTHIILESRYIPELDWFLLVEQDEDLLLVNIRRNLLRNLIFGFLVSCVVILINIYTVNHFQKRLEIMAITDGLTGIANRREFDRHIEQTISLASRQQVPLSVALFDIDSFKKVNDERGHLQGDGVIKGVAAAAKKCLRKSDLLVRWGGDEFSIICYSRIDDARVLLERIRKSVSDEHFFPGGTEGENPTVTISCGVGEYRSGDTAVSLIARVDKALYTAKARGKNRVETADTV